MRNEEWAGYVRARMRAIAPSSSSPQITGVCPETAVLIRISLWSGSSGGVQGAHIVELSIGTALADCASSNTARMRDCRGRCEGLDRIVKYTIAQHGNAAAAW